MVNKTALKNGVRILTKTMAHVRSVSMGVWVNVGARDEALINPASVKSHDNYWIKRDSPLLFYQTRIAS